MTEQLQQDQPKKSWYKRWWGIGLIALAGIVVVGSIFGSGGEQTPVARPQPEASEPAEAAAGTAQPTEAPTQPAPAPSEEPSEPGVGVPVRDGKFEFTVEGVQTGVSTLGNEFLGTTAQGAFTLVTVKVTNIGDQPQTFFDSNVTGIDSQGREVASDSSAGIYANSEAEGFINEINPGNSVTAVIVFDLPVGESLTKVRLQDSAFSNGATVTLS